jgi:uncharacterized membrane protein
VRIVKEVLCWLMGAFYVAAGVWHFVNPAFFVGIVPPHLPWKPALVYVSGVAEIVLGVAVVVPATRRLAAWGIIALLFAVFPANVYMATYQIHPQHAPTWMQGMGPMQPWLRLPMQGVLALWAWWYTRPSPVAR